MRVMCLKCAILIVFVVLMASPLILTGVTLAQNNGNIGVAPPVPPAHHQKYHQNVVPDPSVEQVPVIPRLHEVPEDRPPDDLGYHGGDD